MPKDAAVSADPFLLPHLAHRREAYMFPNPFVTFMFGKNPWQLQNGTEEGQDKVEYVFIDLSRVRPTYNAGMYELFIAEFLNNNNYGLIKFEESYAVFKKGEGYGKGLCTLNDYFATSTASAVKVDLKKALKNESGRHLKDCEALQVRK